MAFNFQHLILMALALISMLLSPMAFLKKAIHLLCHKDIKSLGGRMLKCPFTGAGTRCAISISGFQRQ